MSETQTQTLTAWLLERITEDEAVLMTSRNGSGQTWTEPKYELHDRDCMFLWAVESSDRACECDGKERWRAECEAKRRIVDYITDEPGCPHPWVSEDGKFKRMLGGWCFACDDFLKILALPYADRPGFREEWRS